MPELHVLRHQKSGALDDIYIIDHFLHQRPAHYFPAKIETFLLDIIIKLAFLKNIVNWTRNQGAKNK